MKVSLPFSSNGLKPRKGSVIKSCLATLIAAFINCCNAQVEAPTKMWEAYYEGNESNVPNIVNGMGVDASGNVFVTGYTTNTSIGENMVTVKYDSLGAQDWAQTFTHTFTGNYYNVALGLDGAGNIYTGGNASGYTITKYNTSGTQQWDEGPFDFEGGVCTAMVVDNAGNTYVTGYTDDGGAGTAMYNSSGTLQWSDDYIQPYGVEDMLYCAGMAITVDNSGNVYVSGTVQDPNGDEFGSPTYDLLVLKYSSGGNLDWTYSSGSVSYVSITPEVIAVNNNSGNVYVGLQSGGAMWEFSSAGDYVWMNYGEAGETLTSLLVNPAGDLLVGGTTGTEAFVFEMNPSTPTSAYIWSNVYSGPAGDSAYGTNMAMDASQNVYLTSYSVGAKYSINTVKYNSSGAEQWAIIDSQTSSSQSTSLVVSNTGSDIYMAGTVKDEYYTVKYSVLKPDIFVTAFSPNPVCAGATVSVNYKVQAYTPSGNFILELSNASGSFESPDTLLAFTGADSGTVTAVIPLNTAAGTGFSVRIVSATITGDAYGTAVTVDTTPVVPSLAISANPMQACAGQPITFAATPANGGNSPSYQWIKDGVDVGNNSATYVDSTLTDADSVTCVLTSNATCATPATATGNSVKVSIIQLVTPTITINASPTGTICAGTNVTFTSATTYAGTSPQYQWEINGYVVPGYSDTFTSSTLNNNDVVSCILTSNFSCVTSTTATSNGITILVTGINPTAVVGVTPGSTICAGTSVTLTATPGTGVVSPTYQWMVNNKSVGTGTTGYTYTPSNLDSVWVVTTSNVGCTTLSHNSNLIHFVVNEPPSVALSASNSSCVGNTVLSLTGASSAGQIVWNLAGSPVNTVVPTAIDSGHIIAGGNGSGSAANQLSGPRSVWQDINGNTYVADNGNNRIQEFAAGSTSSTDGVTVAGGNGQGNSPDQVSLPLDVFVNTNGDIYNPASVWVQKFPSGSTSATNQIIVAGSGLSGSGANQFGAAQSVKLDGSGNLYVSDVSNYRVQKFPANSIAGTNAVTVAGGNGAGSAANQFSDVIRIHVDQFGNLFVADAGNNRVQKWAPGATTGTTVAGGNGNGSGADQLNYPTGVFVDGMGNIYVTDQDNNRVQKFPPGSTLSTDAITVAGGNGSGTGYNQVGSAVASYVDNNGNVYVADKNNNQVSKWGQKIATTYTPAASGTYTAVVTSFNGCSATSNPVSALQLVPTIIITASDTAIVAGTKVTFTATITNGGSGPVYQWKKNGTNVGANASTYTDSTLVNGDVIACTLTSNLTCASPVTVASGEIVIKIVITPVASFDATPTIVPIGDTVTFTDLSSNDPTNWSWSFPGGSPSTSTLQNPGIVYNTPGTYSVSLTATNIAGSNTLTKPIYITVINPAGCDTLSNIPKGAELVDYYLQYLDGYAGGPNSEENTAAAEGYSTPSGTVALTSVSFRFYKAKYANIKDSIIVSIWDTNEFGFPGDVIESQALTIADINTSGLTNVTFNVPITIPDRNFYIGYSWNPGDTVVVYADTLVSDTIAGGAWGYGVGYGGWIPLFLIEPYELPSPYTDFAIYPVFCTSGADAPVAAFTGVPTTVTQGDSVHFTDQSTNTPSAWYWVLTGASSTSSSVQNPTVAYNTVGTYDVTLTAANADGSGTLTKSSYITVIQPIPAACDTLANFSDTSTVTIYKDPIDGYISGNSEFGTDGTEEIAEPYTPPASGMLLEGVQFYFGYARYGNPDDGFFVYAWDATGPNGSPGNIIASQWLDFGSVNCLNMITADPPATFVTFATPPIIDGKFYVGFQPTWVPTDTIAVYTTVSGAFPNTGWIDLAPYGWAPYDSVFRYQLTNAILPIICTTTSLPVANFSGTPTTLNAGGSVNFTDLSLNDPTVWYWSFPGGAPSTSSLKNPTDIVYNTPGVYPVTLIATNAGGSDTATKTGYITVDAVTPVANFNGTPTTIAVGGSVSFTDLSTNNPTSWSWTFPGGNPSTSTAQNPTGITYSTAGTYNVSLTATNAGGSNSITKTSYITVVNPTSETCDTIGNLPAGTAIVAYTEPTTGIGTISGNNGIGTSEVAEYLTTPEAGMTVNAVIIDFYQANYSSTSAYVNVHVWDATGAGGAPGNILATQELPISDITGLLGTPTIIPLSSPPVISGTTFYVGVQPYYSSGDTISVYTDEFSTATEGTGWTYTTAAGWESYYETYNPLYGVGGASNAMYAVLCQPAVTPPVANFSGTPTTVTAGGSVNFTDLSTDNPASWSWTFEGGTPSTSTTENPTDIVYNTAGTYNVSLTATNAGGSNSITKTSYITVTDKTPVAAFTANETKACEGSAINFTDQSSNDPASWSWSFPGGTPSTSTQQDPMITYSSPGTYSVTLTATNSGGGNSITKTNYITIGAPPTVSASITDVTCNGDDNGAITINVSGGTSPFSYLWNIGSTTKDISNLDTGTYSLTITDNVGCTVHVTGTVTQPAAISVSVTTTPAVCGQNNGTAVVSVTGGTLPVTFVWSTGQTGNQISGLSGGTYYVTASDAHGCTKITSVQITSTTAPDVQVNATSTTCGLNNGSVSASVSGGSGSYTYTWNNGRTISEISGLPPGYYSVTVNDGYCTATGSATVNSSSSITVTTTTDAANCGQSNGSAMAVASGGSGYTYNWNNGQSNATATGLAAGNYVVTVTATGGCNAVATASVSNIGGPVVSVSKVTDVNCYGGNTGSITLSVSGGNGSYTYNWSSGSSEGNLTNLVANTYEVTVTSNGCISTANATITQPFQLVANAISHSVSCYGGNDGSASALVSGGVGPYTFSWSNNEGDSTITGLASGPYTVTITDHNQCNTTAITTVGQPAQLTINLTGADPGCTGNDGLISASVFGGVPPYTYIWNNSSASYLLTDLGAGIYSVIVSDANHCNISASDTLIAPTGISLSTSSTPSCGSNSLGMASVSVSGGTQPYTYLWSNETTDSMITGLTSGNYSVTVRDGVGCSASASVNVGSGLLLQPDVVNVSGCYGDKNGSITIKVVGGSGSYNFSWSGNETTASISGIGAGNYGVTVTDISGGCETIGNYTISQPAALKDSIATTPTQQNEATGAASITVNGGTPPYNFLWSNGDQGSSVTGFTEGNYSVTVTDADTCILVAPFSISTNLGIRNVDDDFKFDIYPNPNNGLFRIDIAFKDENNCTLQVFDALGNRIYAIEKNNLTQGNFIIDLSGVAAGTYFVQLVSDKYNEVRKITIIK